MNGGVRCVCGGGSGLDEGEVGRGRFFHTCIIMIGISVFLPQRGYANWVHFLFFAFEIIASSDHFCSFLGRTSSLGS